MASEEVLLEKHENYIKQSYRNRCFISTAQGKEMLILPVTQKHGKTLIKDVRVDYAQKWQNNHWRTIESAYRKAPFYEHYSDALHQVLFKRFEFLFDLNLELLSFCLTSLTLRIRISETLAYEENSEVTFLDLRSFINAKKPWQERGIYQSAPYYQVFGSQFVENLSVIDLLFCEGPRATSLLRTSQSG